MSKAKKTIMVIIGLLCIGLAGSLFLLVDFGMDALNVFNAGLANTFGISVGVANLIFYFLVIFVMIFVDRRYLSMATILSFVIVGPSIDLFEMIFSLVVTPDSFIGLRLLFYFLAFFSLSFGVALYLAADFGVSAADMIPVVVSDKFKKQFRWCKVVNDAAVVGLGILLGGAFGLGTIFVVFATGPAIQFIRQKIESRILPQEEDPGELEEDITEKEDI